MMLTVPLSQRRGQVTAMKNSKLLLIIGAAVVLVIAAAVSVMSVQSVRKGGILFSMNAKLRNTIEIPLSQVESLSVSYGSKNLKIYVWQEDEIVVKEYLNSGSGDALATKTIENGKAMITGGQTKWGFNLLWGGLGEKIEIYIPESGLTSLELETGSGNIAVQEEFAFTGDNVSVQAGSGNINWGCTKAASISLKAGSGNIRVQDLIGEQVSVSTNSGNISVKNISGSIYAKAGSGNITLEKISGQCEAETGSGNLKVEAKQVTGDISLVSGSGNQRLELPEGLSFELTVKTGSGNINTDYDSALSYNKKGNEATGQVGNAPASKISLKAGSGNVSVREGH